MTVVIFDNEDNRIACSLYGVLSFDEKEVELETIRSHVNYSPLIEVGASNPLRSYG